MIEVKATLRVRFGVRHSLHTAHELNQQDVDPDCWLIAVGSVANGARDASRLGSSGRQTQTQQQRESAQTIPNRQSRHVQMVSSRKIPALRLGARVSGDRRVPPRNRSLVSSYAFDFQKNF